MALRFKAALTATVSLLAVPAWAGEADDQRVAELGEKLVEYNQKAYGEDADEDGGRKPATRLWSVKPEAQIARADYYSELRGELGEIDQDALSPTAKIDAAVLRMILDEDIGNAQFREWEMPFDSDSNFWSYLNASRPFNTVEEYEAYISRMRDIPRYFGEHIDNARAGLARGFSVPRVTLEGRDASIAAYVVDDPEKSPFWRPFENIPARIPESDAERLRNDARQAIQRHATEGYRTLLHFFRDEYLPNTRTTLAAEAMPDGKAYYQQQIRQYTTLDLTAEQIHEIGLSEVARITAEMEKVKAEAGFEGTLDEFVVFLRTDPQFVARTPDELMGVSAYTAKRVDGVIADYFGFLPRHRFAIREVDPAIAPFYTAGRGGYTACQMNTYDLPSRPLYNIPALTLHECSPGHSFQAAFGAEQPELPEFRSGVYFSGFGEGWGLYTEYLGEEMGIYRTPYERFGRLSYEMWRAVRLVIDTGIHHYGWSREEAIDYLASRTALSEHEVGTEVDRYISWPGQALAYKLGEMTMRRVRAKAEAELGEQFDIRKFHDVVLSLGSVPLPVLEERIDAFIADGGQGLAGVSYD
ncbi:MAG: DUF885 family protein [Sphingomonadaceae bacterium]|nr:DUF885 family protein [Sphingomonadaceae bacterium]MCP5391302.1 DUF885 family protein [Sphingomonadaceae bacterium]MCP5394089.1 DUF885 family protein [Sphingomonadaceae bacterium]